MPSWPIAFDLETIGNPAMIDKLPDPKPASNLKDPEKIANDIEKKRAQAVDRMALNGSTALICACGYAYIDEQGNLIADALVTETVEGEADMLMDMYDLFSVTTAGFITFNGVCFDVPMIMRRLMAHNMTPIVHIDCNKYRMPPQGNHWDMMQILGHFGTAELGSLDFTCDTILDEGKYDDGSVDSKNVGKIWHDGKFDEIKKRAARDAELTYRLWQRANGIYYHFKPRT
jgi:DNA polymerase elongation subunit (family B)